MVDCGYTINDAVLKRLVAAWMLAFAVVHASCCSRGREFKFHKAFPPKPDIDYTCKERDDFVWMVLKKEMGSLQSKEVDDGFVLDSTALITRLLEYFHHRPSITKSLGSLGLAFRIHKCSLGITCSER